MAQSKELVSKYSWTPEFVEELLPCSQKVSLLYNLSYLCLGKFPNCERLLRMRALETQLLFGSSEAVLMKCVGTSENLVSSLFPKLKLAVEKNKPMLAVKYLEKARTWIAEIIQEVHRMVERYDLLNKEVATSTSDIFTEKIETEKSHDQLSKEIDEMKKTLNMLKKKQEENTNELQNKGKLIDKKSQELYDFIREVTTQNKRYGLVAACVPFIGPIIQAVYEYNHSPADTVKIKVLEQELDQLTSAEIRLKQTEWQIQVQIIDCEMKLSKMKIDKGLIPDPAFLGDVQRYLSQIQKILIQLKIFWEKVYMKLGQIKDKTFVDEELVDEPDLQEDFLKSIKTAAEVWGCFGVSCGKAVQIFKMQTKDAYRFLEIDPSSLSQDVWNKEYGRVKTELELVSGSNPNQITKPPK